ncbi:MAG TPA: glycosyltransferase family 2 protein [Catalimonadaceae bacterium]|nr:glycosyltransferase family 2 protein [Catalimonadaceae bacterium]
MPKLSIIIPCYFNEENIPVTASALIENEKLFPPEVEFEYVMVDDGSKDKTLDELVQFGERHPGRVKVVKLVANVGSYNAMVAGMEVATGDCSVIITADLQDPPELMVKMYDYWKKGIKLVVANREAREEGFFKSWFASTFHFLMKNFALSNVPDGGFDYCLFDRKVREEVVAMKEKNTNCLYLMLWLGYDYVRIPYTRRERKIGKSRWTLKKKIKLFVDSFVSFSFLPIRAITTLGFILGFGALLYAILIAFAKITGLIVVSGWSSMMTVILLVSSFQMISIGVLGEYLWRTLDSSRNRPIYLIDKVIFKEQD